MRRAKITITILRGSTPHPFRIPIMGYEFNLKGWELVVHRAVKMEIAHMTGTDNIVGHWVVVSKNKWVVSDVGSGLRIGHFMDSRGEACSNARAIITTKGDTAEGASRRLEGYTKYNGLPDSCKRVNTISVKGERMFIQTTV